MRGGGSPAVGIGVRGGSSSRETIRSWPAVIRGLVLEGCPELGR